MELIKLLARAYKIVKAMNKGKISKETGIEQLTILKLEGICAGYQNDKNFKKVFDQI